MSQDLGLKTIRLIREISLLLYWVCKLCKNVNRNQKVFHLQSFTHLPAFNPLSFSIRPRSKITLIYLK